MAYWDLFVDESGQFPLRSDRVAVGGVLFVEGLPGTGPDALAFAMRRTVPWLPWPLHAWLLDKPVVHALGLTAKGRGRPGDLRAAPEAIAWLRQTHGTAVDTALKALKAGREPSFGVLQALDARLAEHDTLHERWAALSDEVRLYLKRLSAHFASQRAGTLQPPAWLGFAATEGVAPSTGRSAGDRYLRLLRALVEAARAALSRPHVLRVNAAHWRFPTGEVLTREAVETALAGLPGVQVDELVGSGADADALLPFADFIAHRARHAFRDAEKNDFTLERLRRALAERTGAHFEVSHVRATDAAMAAGPRWVLELAATLRAPEVDA